MTDHAAHPPAASTQAMTDNSEGMSYLESLPRKIITLYIPLFIMVVILLVRPTGLFGWKTIERI